MYILADFLLTIQTDVSQLSTKDVLALWSVLNLPYWNNNAIEKGTVYKSHSLLICHHRSYNIISITCSSMLQLQLVWCWMDQATACLTNHISALSLCTITCTHTSSHTLQPVHLALHATSHIHLCSRSAKPPQIHEQHCHYIYSYKDWQWKLAQLD